MTPADERLVPIGRVGRRHGLDGAFVVEQASDRQQRWVVGARLLVEGVPAEIVAARRVGGGKHAILLDTPANRGALLSVARSELPAPGEDEYYVFELVGLRVEDERHEPLGVVAEVHTGVANDNLELDDGTLVPLIEDAIVSIDVRAGLVVVSRGFLSP